MLYSAYEEPQTRGFHFEHTGGVDNDYLPPQIDNNLAHLKPSLKELIIDAPFWGQGDDGTLNEESSRDDNVTYDSIHPTVLGMLNPWIGSLAEFQKLKRVDFAGCMLIREGTRWDKPDHIQSVLGDLQPFLEHLALLRGKPLGVEAAVPILSGGLSHLKTLRLQLDPEVTGKRRWGRATSKNLAGLAPQIGVKFTWDLEGADMEESDGDLQLSVPPAEHIDENEKYHDDEESEDDEESYETVDQSQDDKIPRTARPFSKTSHMKSILCMEAGLRSTGSISRNSISPCFQLELLKFLPSPINCDAQSFLFRRRCTTPISFDDILT